MSYKRRAIPELQNKYETIKIRYNSSYLPLSGAGRARRRGPAGRRAGGRHRDQLQHDVVRVPGRGLSTGGQRPPEGMGAS